MQDDIKFPEGEDPAEFHRPEDAEPDKGSGDTAQAGIEPRPASPDRHVPC